MRRFGYCLGVVIGIPLSAAASAGAQEVSMAERGPRFLVSAPSGPVAVDLGRTPVLRRRITLELRDVTLGVALDTIARKSGLRLGYSRKVVPVDRVVRLVAEDITVTGALSEVLFDTGVDVLFERDGQAAIVRRDAAPDRVQGVVTGRITDGRTGEGLAGADVAIEGTRWRTGTADDGRYRLAEVTEGSHTLVVRRIGYARRTQPVRVVDGQEVTVDVALEPLPTQLDEVVTTVTGEQRLRELGHVVGRINADSLVKAAPVSSLSDLLMGRVSGVQVFQGQGTVGGRVTLQVRGPNSINLGTEPIVIVDGVRYGTDAVSTPLGIRSERTSPLNDLNPNDIESIEVVKGPSAATLYGTDAANGVIVVTTKQGRAGPARWNAYAKGSRTATSPVRYPDAYWGWHAGTLLPTAFSCSLMSAANGFCTQDSVTVLPNPLNNPELAIFGTQPTWETGLSVAGGPEDVRYYFSAGFEDATGPLVMPPAIVERLEERRATRIPDEWREPNTRTNLNLRANVTAQLTPRAEVSVHTGYIRGATQMLGTNNPYAGGFAATPTNPYAPDGSPEVAFTGVATERTDRFVGRAMGQWRPFAWLETRATVGLDLGIRNHTTLRRRGDAASPVNPTVAFGAVSDARARQTATTAELGATATARLGRLSARSSVGAQYVRRLNDLFTSSGSNLPPGGSSVPEAATRFSAQSYTETVTLGSYIEETLGLNERLFLTGALRLDGASTFGQNYRATVYPKLSASWLASEEPLFPRLPGLNELRLRYAYGASGQHPNPRWARPGYVVAQGFVNDAPQPVVDLTSVGNPNIRPERVREHEFGFDATGLGSRVQLGLTWYNRRTVDQIVSVPLAAGYGSIFTNLGLTTQRGFEAELTAHLLDTRLFSWDVVARHSLHRTQLVDLGGAAEIRQLFGGGSYVEGFPLGARFQPGLTYADANGDGILGLNELQVSGISEGHYAGESAPPISQTLTTVFGLFDRRVRVSALVERRRGFKQTNGIKQAQCSSLNCPAAVDPSTPLAQQAEALAAFASPWYVFLEPGDYTRLREATVAVELPTALVGVLRGRSATLSLSGRNLALWTDFSGGDPESSGALSSTNAGGIPQGRTWVLRLDVGF